MRLIASLAAALLLGACGGSVPAITGPVDQVHASNGLEQRLTISTPYPDQDPDWFHLTSTLVNRSDAPITVRVVTCWLDPKVNLRTSASFNGYAIPGCVGEPDVLTLAPGASSNTVWFSGRIERPGTYRIQVRHALDPEFWGEIEITAR